MKPEDFMTYCGGYCGSCARYVGFTAFRDAATLIAEVADAHGFQFWMPSEVKEFDYEEFRKGLEFFRREDTWLVCREGCKGGGGGPPNCVRRCCIEHGVDVCFECGEFPCDKAKENAGMLRRGEEYKKLGREKWLEIRAEKAKQGLENHIGKYYEIHVRDGLS